LVELEEENKKNPDPRHVEQNYLHVPNTSILTPISPGDIRLFRESALQVPAAPTQKFSFHTTTRKIKNKNDGFMQGNITARDPAEACPIPEVCALNSVVVPVGSTRSGREIPTDAFSVLQQSKFKRPKAHRALAPAQRIKIQISKALIKKRKEQASRTEACPMSRNPIDILIHTLPSRTPIELVDLPALACPPSPPRTNPSFGIKRSNHPTILSKEKIEDMVEERLPVVASQGPIRGHDPG
jgi:hypothetical protein